MVTYYYCPVCKKEIEPEDRIRKPMTSMQKVVWVIIILGTVGIGLFPFLIYYFGYKNKQYCPICNSKLATSTQAFEKPEEEIEPRTPREKVLKKAGKPITRKKEVKKSKKPKKPKKDKEEEMEEDKIFCPYCGAELSKRSAKCTNCGASLKDRIEK
ncbi:MAG: zinc ribbon domain-containing protein [Promethearchaeati archaeon]